MWVLLWIIVSVFVIGIFFWNFQILMQRKSAWKKFADRHKLEYTSNSLMQSPSVTGMLSGLRIYLYEDVQQTDDITGQRFVTSIDVDLGEGFPTGAALATREYKEFLSALNFRDTYTINENFREKEYIVRARSAKALKEFMTEERIKIIENLFSMKNSIVLFFFDELEAIMHIETTDPLVDIAHIEKIFKKVLTISKRIMPEEHEKAHLTDEQRKKLMEAGQRTNTDNKTSLVVPTDAPVDLELEEDDETEDSDSSEQKEGSASKDDKTETSSSKEEDAAPSSDKS